MFGKSLEGAVDTIVNSLDDEALGRAVIEGLGGWDSFSLDDLEECMHEFDFKSYGQDLIDRGQAFPSADGWLDIATLEDDVNLSWYTPFEINEMAKGIAHSWSEVLKKRTDALLGNTDPLLEAYQRGDVAQARDYLIHSWAIPRDNLSDDNSLILSSAVLAGYLEATSSDHRSPQKAISAVKEALFDSQQPFKLIDFANAIVQYEQIPFYEWTHGGLHPGEDPVERLGWEVFERDHPESERSHYCDPVLTPQYFDYAKYGASLRDEYKHGKHDAVVFVALEGKASEALEKKPSNIEAFARDFASKAGVSDAGNRQIKR